MNATTPPNPQSELAKKGLMYIPLAPGQTVDDLAYKIIYDYLLEHHRPILEHLQAQMAADKEFREGYAPKPSTPF